MQPDLPASFSPTKTKAVVKPLYLIPFFSSITSSHISKVYNFILVCTWKGLLATLAASCKDFRGRMGMLPDRVGVVLCFH